MRWGWVLIFRKCREGGGSRFLKKQELVDIYAYTWFDTQLMPGTKINTHLTLIFTGPK
jgi:hypothetical protein